MIEEFELQVATLTTKESWNDLAQIWRGFNTKRKELETEAKAYKKFEDCVAMLLSNKLVEEKLPLVKTQNGTFANKITTTIKTVDKEAFFKCLYENFEQFSHLLLTKPFSIPLMKKEFKEGDLPPGLQLESIMKLSVTK